VRVIELGLGPAALACLEATAIAEVKQVVACAALERLGSGHVGPTAIS